MGLSINDVVYMAVSFLLVAVLGPIAIGTVMNTSTTGWDAAVKTIFQVLLPILWVIGVAIAYIPKKGSG
jgi:predicted Na+-dependent transporter